MAGSRWRQWTVVVGNPVRCTGRPAADRVLTLGGVTGHASPAQSVGGGIQDQAGTTPRTTRNIMGNDRGPSGKPIRYPARTCCSIAPRTSSESAIKGPLTLPGPPVNVAQ